MASRSKKKQQNQQVIEKVEPKNVTAPTPIRTDKKVLFSALLVFLCIAVFAVVFFAPILSINVNIEVEDEDPVAFSSQASVYRIIFAPARGVYDSFDFLLEQSGLFNDKVINSGAVEIDYDAIMTQEQIAQFKQLGVAIFVLSLITIGMYLVMICLKFLDSAKKKHYLLSLIGNAIFLVPILILIILTIVALISTLGLAVSLIPGWGIWIALFITLAMLGCHIYLFILDKKEAKNEVR